MPTIAVHSNSGYALVPFTERGGLDGNCAPATMSECFRYNGGVVETFVPSNTNKKEENP